MFVGLSLLYGAVMFFALIAAIMAGKAKTSAALVQVISPVVGLIFIWGGMQHFHPAINVGSASWAGLFGDALPLPVMAYFLARAWAEGYDVLHGTRWTGWRWRMICLASGLAGGVAFHRVLGGSWGDSGSLDVNVRMHASPTAIFHDYGVVSSLLAGLLLAGFIPVVVKYHELNASAKRYVWLAFWLGLMPFLGLFFLDGLRGFNPHWLDDDTLGLWPFHWRNFLWFWR